MENAKGDEGTKVSNRPEWIHEIKHDGYRLIVRLDGRRVRLWTRNGHDWSGRFPRITEAALRNRNHSFVIEGEEVGCSASRRLVKRWRAAQSGFLLRARRGSGRMAARQAETTLIDGGDGRPIPP